MLLTVLFLAPVLSGCLVARLPGLFDDGPPAAAKQPTARTNATEPFRLEGITWKTNDTWVWDAASGARITDRVTAVRTVQKVVAGRILNVTRYDVQTKEEWTELLTLWSNHTYEPELGVVNSSAPGESARYVRGDAEWRSIPLTYVGPTKFNTTVEIERFGAATRATRSTDVTLLGRRITQSRAGDFQTWHVRYNTTVGYSFEFEPLVSVTERLFNETVKNDVRFTRSGVLFDLVDYRVDGDRRAMQLPPAAPAPAGWQAGWAWRYRGPDNLTITRTVYPCLPGDTAPIHDLCRKQYVHQDGLDYYEMRTIYEVHTGGRAITLRDISLVDVKTQATKTLAFYRTLPPTAWLPRGLNHLNFSGNIPSVVPPPSDTDYRYVVRGEHESGLLVNHTASARVDISPHVVSTALARFTGTRVYTNTTYHPIPLDRSTYREYSESSDRTYSSLVRQDVRFLQAIGSSVAEFTLEAVSFGEARKPERDL